MPPNHQTTHPLTGTVRWRAEQRAPGAPVVLLDDWAERHLQRVRVPQLAGKPTPGRGRFDGHLRFFQPGVPQLLAAWQAVEDEGLLARVTTFGGAFEPRLRRDLGRGPGPSRDPLSPHALGLAFDLNPEHYPLGERCLPYDQPGSLRRLVPLFERHGFAWQGWQAPYNGAQFELARLLEPGELLPIKARLVLEGRLLHGLVALRTADGVWAEPQPLAAQLGGAARVGGEGAAPTVEITAGGRTTALAGRPWQKLVLVQLDELLALFGHEAAPQPGQELIGLVPGATAAPTSLSRLSLGHCRNCATLPGQARTPRRR